MVSKIESYSTIAMYIAKRWLRLKGHWQSIFCKDQWLPFLLENSENIVDKSVIHVAVVNAQTDTYQMLSYTLPMEAANVFVCDGGILLANKDWSHSTILAPVQQHIAQYLLERVFYSNVANDGMLRIHCATIDDHGRGILFLGPSGIGKTTQAERWMQYRGSTIINGDVGLVQRTESGYLAWGTPWHGSSPYCLNASVPVKALVVLKQAPENRLHQLTGFEKVAEVSGSVFYPTWLENGMELCTDTLNHLLTDLPVYRLDNRADEEAVNLLAAELDRIT